MRLEINMSLADGMTLHTAAMNLQLPLFVGYHEGTHICWIEFPDEWLINWRAARSSIWAELQGLGMPALRRRNLVVELWDKLAIQEKKESSTISRFIKGEV